MTQLPTTPAPAAPVQTLPSDIRNNFTLSLVLDDGVLRQYPALHFGTIGQADPTTGAEPTEVYIIADINHSHCPLLYYKRPQDQFGTVANTTPLNALTADDISRLVAEQMTRAVQEGLVGALIGSSLRELGVQPPVGPTPVSTVPTGAPQSSDPFTVPPLATTVPTAPVAWTPPTADVNATAPVAPSAEVGASTTASAGGPHIVNFNGQLGYWLQTQAGPAFVPVQGQ